MEHRLPGLLVDHWSDGARVLRIVRILVAASGAVRASWVSSGPGANPAASFRAAHVTAFPVQSICRVVNVSVSASVCGSGSTSVRGANERCPNDRSFFRRPGSFFPPDERRDADVVACTPYEPNFTERGRMLRRSLSLRARILELVPRVRSKTFRPRDNRSGGWRFRVGAADRCCCKGTTDLLYYRGRPSCL